MTSKTGLGNNAKRCIRCQRTFNIHQFRLRKDRRRSAVCRQCELTILAGEMQP